MPTEKTRITQWNGEEIIRKIERDTKESIDEVNDEAANIARSSHWWKNRTGNLEARIITEPASKIGNRILGAFGTGQDKGFYGLILERKHAFLRPAADIAYHTLKQRIKDKRHA